MQKLASGFVELNWLKIMLNSILISAAMLLSGPSMSASKMTVEPQGILAPIMVDARMIADATLQLLIQGHAAPHWNLSFAEAWYQYSSTKAMKITEIAVGIHYVISFDGGILDVLLDDDGM
jgi:hypothetical protein